MNELVVPFKGLSSPRILCEHNRISDYVKIKLGKTGNHGSTLRLSNGQKALLVGDTNHQCSKQRLSPKNETYDHAQKACLVCGKNVGGESNHNPNKD